MKNMSFILWKKLNGLSGQPNSFYIKSPHQIVRIHLCLLSEKVMHAVNLLRVSNHDGMEGYRTETLAYNTSLKI